MKINSIIYWCNNALKSNLTLLSFTQVNIFQSEPARNYFEKTVPLSLKSYILWVDNFLLKIHKHMWMAKKIKNIAKHDTYRSFASYTHRSGTPEKEMY